MFIGASLGVFWTFRIHSHFLGDGALWLSRIQAGDRPEGHEPLAEALWTWAAAFLRSIRLPPTPDAVALVSVAMGGFASALAWGIAREFHRLGLSFFASLALIVTLGSSQLYFGYIESYPAVLAAEAAVIFVGIRTARTGTRPLALAAVTALAVVAHVACVVLIPGFALVVWRNVRQPMRRALYLLATPAAAFLVMTAMGYDAGQLSETLRIGARAIVHGGAAAPNPRDARPYGIVSWPHLVDMGNEVSLVAPAALLLGLAMLPARMKSWPRTLTATGGYLAIIAASGIAAWVLLVLPVAAAQDWDLGSILIVPGAIAAIYAGGALVRNPDGAWVAAGLSLLGATTLGAFVLVNVDRDAGVRRYETLVGPRAVVTPFARVYAYELLATYYRQSGEPERALAYAKLLIKAEPTNPRLWARVGAILSDQRQYADAARYLEVAIARGARSAGTYTNLGICYSSLGRSQAALRQFREAARLEPDRADHQLNLALGLLACGEADSAKLIMIKTLRVWPRDLATMRALDRHFPGTR